MTPFAAELDEGINNVVAPVSLLYTDVRSICCPASTWPVCVDLEYSCKAFRRASWKLASSTGVRFSRRRLIWSSLRTERVIVVIRPAIPARSGPERGVCK